MKTTKLILIMALMLASSCIQAQEKTKPPKPPRHPEKVRVIANADSEDVYVDIPEIDIPEINIPDIHIPDIKVSLEQERKILEDLKPRLKKEMEKIKKLNKLKYHQLLMDNQFRNFEFPLFGKRSKEDRERLKKITELEIETESMALEYKKADKSEREKIKQNLQTKLSELFELREDNRKEEVKDLEGRLSELNKTLDERRKNKDKIIQNRLLDLTGEDETTEW